MIERFSGLIATLRASADGDSKERKISCDAYTGATVDRFDYWTGERYKLRLSLEGVDLSRVTAKACPVLDDHNAYGGSESIIGIVENAYVMEGALKADMRFSMDPEVDSIWNKIQEGVIASVSVGAKIGKLRDVSGENDKIKTYLAENWTLMEISPTGIPADAQAGFLSAQLGRDTIDLNNFLKDGGAPAASESNGQEAAQKGESMDDKTTMNPQTAGLNPPPAAGAAQVLSIDDAKKQATEAANLAVQAERKRTADIRTLVKTHNLSEEFASKAINEGWDSAKLHAEALNEMASREEKLGQQKTHHSARISHDEREKLRDGMEAGLMLRVNPRDAKLQEKGRDFAGFKLLEMARLSIERCGISTLGWSPNQIAEVALNPRHEKFGGMQTTSDLANIVANVANKSLRQAYEAAPKTFQPFCRMATAADFKPVNRVQMSDVSALTSINEHGEFKRVTVGDSKETYTLGTFGGIIAITRKVIVNDDLSALDRIPAGMGIAAANVESDTVWGIITTNGNMSDAVPIFHATHKNLKTTNALAAVANITAARAQMRKQTGPKGTILNLVPKFLIVPAALEGIAVQLTNPVNLAATASSADVPAFVRTMIPIVEPRLDAVASVGETNWFTAADPAVIDTIEYCYLEGQQGVYTEMRTGFEVDGVEVKARLDFAAGAIDFRGLQKNTQA